MDHNNGATNSFILSKNFSRYQPLFRMLNLNVQLIGSDGNNASELCPPGENVDYPPPDLPDFFENFSYPFNDRYVPTWEVALKSTFYAIAMLMATVGNILVLLAICFNPKLQRPTYIYIANLALSDLVVGTFNMWMHLIPNVIPSWPLGSVLCEASIFIRSEYIHQAK